jgi:hypothetical protein
MDKIRALHSFIIYLLNQQIFSKGLVASGPIHGKAENIMVGSMWWRKIADIVVDWKKRE